MEDRVGSHKNNVDRRGKVRNKEGGAISERGD